MHAYKLRPRAGAACPRCTAHQGAACAGQSCRVPGGIGTSVSAGVTNVISLLGAWLPPMSMPSAQTAARCADDAGAEPILVTGRFACCAGEDLPVVYADVGAVQICNVAAQSVDQPDDAVRLAVHVDGDLDGGGVRWLSCASPCATKCMCQTSA
jgi:hypothetical protein